MPATRRNFLACSSVPFLAAAPAAKPRLRRKDSFFGFHLDLHPSPSDTVLGRDVTEEMIEQFLEKTEPDYVQYDCKGVSGLLGYPSKIGPSAPGIIKDSLEIWRRVTARRGVALYIHFCALWDQAAMREHPE